MDLTQHVLKGVCVVLTSECWNVMTGSLSFFSKWGHRRKKASSSACNTTLWEDAELSKYHWETGEAGTSLGSRQRCSRLLLYPEIHFSWHWVRIERWGKNNFFLKKNPQNKTKKYLNKAKALKLSPNLSLRKLSGVCQELMFILISQAILKINSPGTIAFLFHICQAQYLSRYSCIKVWNMYGWCFTGCALHHWEGSAHPAIAWHGLCPQPAAGAAADGHALLIPTSLNFLLCFLGWGYQKTHSFIP